MMMNNRLLAALAKAMCAYAVLTGSPAFGQAYTAHDIGFFGGVAFDTTVTHQTSMNGSGQILANVFRGNQIHYVLTGTNGTGATELGLFWNGTSLGSFVDARGVNDLGQVAGTVRTVSAGFGAVVRSEAFITGPGGAGKTPILPVGSALTLDGQSFTVASSTAHGVNARGQVIGTVIFDGGGVRSFVTGPNGAGAMLVPGAVIDSNGQQTPASLSPEFINDAGQMVGSFSSAGGNGTYITDPGGTGFHVLDAPANIGAINASGRLLGLSQGQWVITGANGIGTSIIASQRSTSGSDSLFSEFLGINNAGQVVGKLGRNAVASGADGLGLTDLNTQVQLPGGDWLGIAFSINDAGQILAQSALQSRLYLLTPVPESGSLSLLMFGPALVLSTTSGKRMQGDYGA